MSSPDETEINELRALMHDHGLLPDLPASHRPDPAVSDLRLQRILSTAPRRHRWNIRLPAAAAAAVVGAVVVWTLTSGSETASAFPAPLTYSTAQAGELATAPDATTALTELASGAQRAAAQGAGAYQHVTMAGWLLAVDADTDAVEVAVTRTESLLGPDGSAALTQGRGPSLTTDGRLHPSTNAVPGHGETRDSAPAGTYDPNLAAGLPLEPQDLRDALLTLAAGMQCSTPAQQTRCIVDEIQFLYSMYVIPSPLANSLWQVLADEPGVRDLGTTSDRLDRPAHAVAVPSLPSEPAQRVLILLISPDTGRLTGTETVTLYDEYLSINAPTVTGFQTWIEARRTPNAKD